MNISHRGFSEACSLACLALFATAAWNVAEIAITTLIMPPYAMLKKEGAYSSHKYRHLCE